MEEEEEKTMTVAAVVLRLSLASGDTWRYIDEPRVTNL
jgi:hypothetical protein